MLRPHNVAFIIEDLMSWVILEDSLSHSFAGQLEFVFLLVTDRLVRDICPALAQVRRRFS